MLSQEQLDQIRAAIAEEPKDSPARLLLAEVYRLREEANFKVREDAVRRLMKWQYLTELEATRVYEGIANGGKFETEEGPCRKCNATGYETGDSHCFGFHFERCSRCGGTRIDKERVKIPV